MFLRHPLALGLVVLLAGLGARPAAAQDDLGAAADRVKRHFVDRAAAYSVGAADLSDLAVTNAYTDRRTGATHVYLRQRANGIEVFNATALAVVDRAGAVHAAQGQFLRDLVGRANRPQPALSAAQAVEAAARHLGLAVTGPLALLEERPGVAGGALLTGGGVSTDPIPVRLFYFADGDGALRPVWDLAIDSQTPSRVVDDGVLVPGASHLWSVRVDAHTGAVVEVTDLVAHDNWQAPRRARGAASAAPDFAPLAPPAPSMANSYNVFPSESPSHGVQTLVANPANAAASPSGWHQAGATSYTITRGNNVHAYADQDVAPAPPAPCPGCDQPDPGSEPNGGAGHDFPAVFNPAA
jgi:hypothetical protein